MSAPLEWAPLLKGNKLNERLGAHSDNYGKALRFFFQSQEKIRNSCNDLSVRDLNKSDGLGVLIGKIKALLARAVNALVFILNDLKILAHMTWLFYINEW